MPTEHEIVASAPADQPPVTSASLFRDLTALGLTSGATVLVHASLSKLGWVAGGAQAVIEAIEQVLGDAGTLVMPTHTTQLSEPSLWVDPPVPEAWWPILRSQTPAFDPDATPTRNMGAIAENFRRLPGVRRSLHPHGSFAAKGPYAEEVIGIHENASMFGERSPLGTLYRLDAWVLLLGIGYANNTSLHLSEYRADFKAKRWHTEGAPVIENGERRWIKFEGLRIDDEDFPQIGEAFANATNAEHKGSVGWGEGRLMRCRDIVDFGVTWMEANR